MFDDAYQELDDQNREVLFRLLSAVMDGSPYDPSLTKTLYHALPFYPHHIIVEANENHGNGQSRMTTAILPDDMTSWSADNLTLLDGTNVPIYKLNESVPVRIDQHTVTYYIQFFFLYVRGEQGIFDVIQSVEDIKWFEAPAPAGKVALSKMIEPLQIREAKPEAITVKANIIFKDSLFESDITVQSNGLVTLSNQEILVEDLPIIDQNFG
ncbi:MAG: hypothetical protein AAF549_00370 [Pseudomonadota bacterium]